MKVLQALRYWKSFAENEHKRNCERLGENPDEYCYICGVRYNQHNRHAAHCPHDGVESVVGDGDE